MTGPESVEPGGSIDYAVTLTNSGTATADTAGFIATLPQTGNVWAFTSEPPAGCAISGTTLRCDGLQIVAGGGTTAVGVTSSLGTDPVICQGLTAVASLNGGYTGSDPIQTSVACASTLALTANGAFAGPSDGAPFGSVAYTLTAANTGNTALTEVQVYESTASYPLGLVISCSIDGDSVEQPVTLPVGKSIECTASYALALHHMDEGVLEAIPEAYSRQTDPSRQYLTTELPRTPAITIDTIATNVPDDGFNRGDVANFVMTVTNSGNVTLTGLTVSDDSGRMQVDCGTVAVSLAPGKFTSCSATLAISQDDVETGVLTTTTRVSANAPQGTDPATVTANDRVSVPTNNTPGIGLWMTVDPKPETLVAGTVITYELRASNTGKVTLTDVTIADGSIEGLSDLSCRWNGDQVEQPFELAPEMSYLCTATYTITQDDVDRGLLTNTASVTGTYSGQDVTDTATLTIGDPAMRTASVELTIVADPQSGVTAGTEVSYTFTVRNTGTVTLTDLIVTGDTTGAIDCGDGTNVIATLAPGGSSVNCTGTFTVTQAFIDAYAPDGGAFGWSMTSVASVVADAPDGMSQSQVSDNADVTISGMRTVSIDLSKAVTQVDGEDVVSGEAVTGLRAGQVVTYTLIATNTGDVTLGSVRITDSLLDGLTCDGTEPVSLAPGKTVECTGTLLVTQEIIDTDVDRQIENIAEVTAVDPQENAVVGSHSAIIHLEAPAPALRLQKDAVDADMVPVERVGLGDEITYIFSVVNTGNLTVTGITIQDEMLASAGIVIPVAGDLAPGETARVMVPYTVTATDVEPGVIVNEAAAIGTDARGEVVTSPSSTETVTVAQNPGLELGVEISAPDGGVHESSNVDLIFTVTNGGDVTLRDVELMADLPGIVWRGDEPELASLAFMTQASTGGSIGDLAPGETVTVYARYTVTPADVEGGEVRGSAVVFGTGPTGEVVSSETSEIAIEVDQPASAPTPVQDGALAPVDEAASPQPSPPVVTKLPSTGTTGDSASTVGLWIFGTAAVVLLAASLGIQARARR